MNEPTVDQPDRAQAPAAPTDPAVAPAAGRCTLVGAGPGDPELLTLKAVRAIGEATVLFVDDLVGEGVLAHARPGARIVHVGKRGGCRSTPQAFIERLMIAAVREGETVVRLKGGDPFVFGRGGEEVEHLRAAGIDCRVVNGVTAGLAAVTALGVPLTHRDHAQGVIFVTGHARRDGAEVAANTPGDGPGSVDDPPGVGAAGPDFARLARTADDCRLTLVIYMGVAGVGEIQAALLQGLPASTPAAVVQSATLPAERRLVTTLGRLADDVAGAGLGSPAVIVVGDVLVGLRATAAAPARRFGT